VNARGRRIGKAALEICAWLVGLVYLFPLYLEFTIALKTQEDFKQNLYGLPRPFTFSNLSVVWKRMHVPAVTLRSLLIAAVSIAGIVLFSSLAAYAIARRNNRFYRAMYVFFIAGMMVPFQLSMIPLYKLIRWFGMMSSYQGVICIYIGSGISLATMIFTGFIRTIPRELDESAMMDGCTKLRTYSTIILPFLAPAVISVIVFMGVYIWNDLLTPLLFLGSKKATIITALYSFRGATYTTDWTMVFAGSVLAMIPLTTLFLFSQRYFIKGMMAGALKG
jgi:raffinose/stachyose/melibiose transport system permease protein